VVFWVMTSCSDVTEGHAASIFRVKLGMEAGICVLPHHYTMLLSRKTTAWIFIVKKMSSLAVKNCS